MYVKPESDLKPKSAALECKNVKKTFFPVDEFNLWRIFIHEGRQDSSLSGYDALKDISIEVPKGEMVGVMGLNGAGKSTLLRTVSGVYLPTSGVVMVNGEFSGLYELGVTGNDQLTGKEFAERWLMMMGVKKADQPSLIEDIRHFSELGDFFRKAIFKYSSGMKARLFFSVATALPQKIYLIDEVLAVGDEHFQEKCWSRLRERASQGVSGILATHDWSAVLKLCRYSYVLGKGMVLDGGLSREIVQRYLGLSPPIADKACLQIGNGHKFVVNGGKDATLEIPVVSNIESRIGLGISIEWFRKGVGWIHMLHKDVQMIMEGMGKRVIGIEIPKLPLAAGIYSLNLFLNDLETGESLDVRSWAYSNDLLLEVTGVARPSMAVLPMTWKIVGGTG